MCVWVFGDREGVKEKENQIERRTAREKEIDRKRASEKRESERERGKEEREGIIERV